MDKIIHWGGDKSVKAHDGLRTLNLQTQHQGEHKDSCFQVSAHGWNFLAPGRPVLQRNNLGLGLHHCQLQCRLRVCACDVRDL